MSPTILMICAGIFFAGLITGGIIAFAGIHIGREIERMHIIIQVHRHQAKAQEQDGPSYSAVNRQGDK